MNTILIVVIILVIIEYIILYYGTTEFDNMPRLYGYMFFIILAILSGIISNITYEFMFNTYYTASSTRL